MSRRSQLRQRYDRETANDLLAQRRGGVRVRSAGLQVTFRQDGERALVRIVPLGVLGDVGIVFDAEHLDGLIAGLRELQRQIQQETRDG